MNSKEKEAYVLGEEKGFNVGYGQAKIKFEEKIKELEEELLDWKKAYDGCDNSCEKKIKQIQEDIEIKMLKRFGMNAGTSINREIKKIFEKAGVEK